LNQRPLGYEPNELPDCSTPLFDFTNPAGERSNCESAGVVALKKRVVAPMRDIALTHSQ
jgi:hypothetical protein